MSETGEHMKRRIVLLDEPIEGVDNDTPPRWNVALSDLSALPTNEKQP